MRSILTSFFVLSFLSLVLVAVPTQARAASLTETQIQAIISLISSFGADSGTLNNVSAALRGQVTTGATTPAASSAASCLSVNNNLYVDATDATTDGEVSKLQRFLGGRVTGYFGPATLQLVQNWQTAYGVVSSGSADTTGYGYVGPKTRVAMGCLGSTVTNTQLIPKTSTLYTNTPTIPICTLTADKNTAFPGDVVTLSWTSKDATYASWAQDNAANLLGLPLDKLSDFGSQRVTIAGKGNVNPTLSVFGKSGSGSCSTTLSIITSEDPTPTPTMSLSVSPAPITEGHSSTLKWTSTNANRCGLQYDSIEENISVNGTKTVTPSKTTTYFVWCTNDPGTGKDGPSVRQNVTLSVSSKETLVGVTAVGVYEGSYPAGVQHSYNFHPEGTVNVKVTGDTGQNRALVLASYEPVNWVLSVPSHVVINKIIVTGYHKSRVTNVPSGTQVEYHSYDTDGQYYYAYQASGDSFTRINQWLTGLYRAPDGELYGNFVFPGYSASSVEAYVGYKG